MSNIRTSIIIDLVGNISRRAAEFSSSLSRLGSAGANGLAPLKRTLAAVGSGLDRLGNRYTALLTGAAGLGTVRQVGNLSQQLTYLGIQANASREEIDKLYGRILDTAQMPDIRVDPAGLVAGVETIVEKLGDLDLAKDNLRAIGLVMRATGADGRDAGDMIANFREKFDLKSPDEMLSALDILVKQGKAGAFTLKDMVTQGNRVTAAYGAMGRKGIDAVREMGAVLQVFRKSSGTAEDTSTAFKNFFNDLMEPAKQKILQGAGISIWDPEQLKSGKKVIRSIVDIIDEIMTKTKGDPEKLSRLFGMQSMDGMKSFISTWQSSGKNAAQEFMDVQGDGAQLLEDSARAAKEFNAAIESLHTAWMRFASSNLTKPIQTLADKINEIKPETLQAALKVAAGGALALGGLVVGNKVQKAGRGILGLFGKGKGAGAVAPGVGGMLAGNGPIPVYVVNDHLSMLPGKDGFGLGGAGEAAGEAAGKGGLVSRLARYGKNFLGATAAGAAGWEFGTLINDYLLQGTKVQDKMGEALNKIAALLGNQESKLAIEINTKGGGTAKVVEMQAKGMQIDVDSGPMTVGTN